MNPVISDTSVEMVTPTGGVTGLRERREIAVPKDQIRRRCPHTLHPTSYFAEGAKSKCLKNHAGVSKEGTVPRWVVNIRRAGVTKVAKPRVDQTTLRIRGSSQSTVRATR